MDRVAIVGGGLAGLAAAVALAGRGCAVTVLEARPRLGGRATSFRDPATDQLVDACQHVSMGCCTAFHRLCRTVGVFDRLAPQPVLHFRTPDGRTSRFAADPWPAPLHLGRALASAHYLTAAEKLRIGYGLARLVLEPPDADPPLLPWLLAHAQTRRTIDRFWGVVLTSALNETPERCGLKYARKVFRDGFLSHRDAFTVHVPTGPLAELYGPPLLAWLAAHGVVVRTGVRVEGVEVDLLPPSIEGGPGGVAFRPTPPPGPLPQGERGSRTDEDSWSSKSSDPLPLGEGGGVSRREGSLTHSTPPGPPSIEGGREKVAQLRLRDGSPVVADQYILAVPFGGLPDMLPPPLAADPFFARVGGLAPSPITSVHFWFDRPVMRLPHAVLVGCLGQWVFNRGQVAPGLWYVQAVVSAARGQGGGAEVQRLVLEELGRLDPAVKGAVVKRARVVTERAATFSAVPGVDAFRPPQATPVPNLTLAGDWTATGWPATMEGAVRSGELAAEAVLARLGRPERVLTDE